MFQIELEQETILNLCENFNIAKNSDNSIRNITKLDSTIWIGTTGGLFKFDLPTKRLVDVDTILANKLTNEWVQHIAKDEFGNLWVGTGSGLNHIDLKTNKVTHYKRNIHDKSGMSSDDIMCIYIDKNGLIWLGTYTGGLNILNPQRKGFVSVLTKSDTAKYGLNNTVHGITKDDQENLWISVFGAGVFKLDLMTGELKQAYFEQDERLGLAYSLLFDQEKRLWVGTNDGLLIFSPEENIMYDAEIFINDKATEFYNYVFKIYEDHQGQIWLGTLQGLYSIERIVKEDNQLKLFLDNRTNELPYTFRDKSTSVSSIEEIHDGSFWIGGTAGLVVYEPKDKTWRHLRYENSNESSLSNDNVQSIFQDSRGTIWIGTANGLNRAVRNSENDVYFERITRKNGLPNNSIYGILEDKKGKVWLSTNQGLVRYSDFNETIQLFSYRDGISSNEFNTGAYYSDSEGILYFGSINGVTVVSGDDFFRKRTPNLKFSKVVIGQEDFNVYELNHSKSPEIKTKLRNRSVNIEVADIYYHKLATQVYRYRILELSERWIYLNRTRSFVIAGLEEGTFNVQIESKVGDENWGQTKMNFKLIVEEGFWQSTKSIYFLAMLSLAFLVISIGYVRHLFKDKLQKHQNRLKVESIRLKEVKRQNEEFRGELAQRIIDVNHLKTQLNEKEDYLESLNFKDPLTGLYRYQMLDNLLDESVQDNELYENLNLIMVFRIKNLLKIKSNFGVISSSEARVGVINEIRKHLPSNVHIASESDDRVIIFGNSIEDKKLSSLLHDLSNYLLKTPVVVANDKVVDSEIISTYLEIYPDRINKLDQLKKLADLLIEVDKNRPESEQSNLLRVDLNVSLDKLNDVSSNISNLIDTNQITLHYLR